MGCLVGIFCQSAVAVGAHQSCANRLVARGLSLWPLASLTAPLLSEFENPDSSRDWQTLWATNRVGAIVLNGTEEPGDAPRSAVAIALAERMSMGGINVRRLQVKPGAQFVVELYSALLEQLEDAVDPGHLVLVTVKPDWKLAGALAERGYEQVSENEDHPVFSKTIDADTETLTPVKTPPPKRVGLGPIHSGEYSADELNPRRGQRAYDMVNEFERRAKLPEPSPNAQLQIRARLDNAQDPFLGGVIGILDYGDEVEIRAVDGTRTSAIKLVENVVRRAYNARAQRVLAQCGSDPNMFSFYVSLGFRSQGAGEPLVFDLQQ